MVKTIEPTEHTRCDECTRVTPHPSSSWHRITYCTRPGDIPLDFCGDRCLLAWVLRTHRVAADAAGRV